MKKQSPKPESTHHELAECDLEFPRFQKELEQLELKELQELEKCLEKIEKMTWAQILATSSKQGKRGLNWEPIANQKTKSGATIASIRITQKFRARVTREGVSMRFISLHPDHDSAYDERGGEQIPVDPPKSG